MLASRVPVVSVCAVRTGSGKSAVARRVVRLLKEAGKRAVVVRHPMPYGDLARQAVQRFASPEDLVRHECTIEEREEYEPHLACGTVVFAGVDYERILRAAEAEADVIVWDGGNNDTPFFAPALEVVLVDPHRAGHERSHFPGLVNFLRAHVVVIAKVDTARPEDVAAVRRSIAELNPGAVVVDVALPLKVDGPERIRGRRVLVVEDGPTITHGGMAEGAGAIAARRCGAAALIDPRPFAAGSLAGVYAAYPHIGPVLPAMGYGREQTLELERTIAASGAEAVVVGTPIDLGALLTLDRPVVRVRYEAVDAGPVTLADALAPVTGRRP